MASYLCLKDYKIGNVLYFKKGDKYKGTLLLINRVNDIKTVQFYSNNTVFHIESNSKYFDVNSPIN